MTSAETHDPTVAHFERNEFFGFPPGDVVFFQQHRFPCLAEDGEIILKAPAKVDAPLRGCFDRAPPDQENR